MRIKGRAWKFGDGVSTDDIAPGRYFHLRSQPEELAKHAFEDLRPDFAKNVKPGDIIVGGRNFGQGSSREHAPLIIKLNGVGAIMAKSVARIFFRNAINLGLPVIIVDTDKIDDGDEIEIDLEAGTVKDLTKNFELKFKPLPEAMLKILRDGGLVAHVKKHGGFAL